MNSDPRSQPLLDGDPQRLDCLERQLRQMDAKNAILALGLDLLHGDVPRQLEFTPKLPVVSFSDMKLPFPFALRLPLAFDSQELAFGKHLHAFTLHLGKLHLDDELPLCLEDVD